MEYSEVHTIFVNTSIVPLNGTHKNADDRKGMVLQSTDTQEQDRGEEGKEGKALSLVEEQNHTAEEQKHTPYGKHISKNIRLNATTYQFK